ncbi:MAG: PAAR domain-containing protein [Lyngbya sp.]|nr:PAAR domain-containing protein [Lyngbya sp.]
MVGKPAARLGDMTAHGTVLKPGLGSPNVMIGGKPAWRGLNPAAATQLAKAMTEVMISVNKFTAATSTGNPVLAADALKEMEKGISKAVKIMGSVDQHFCEMLLVPPVPPPHANGVVINGSSTVLINGLPACRQGDMIQETVSVNTIALGCPTVLIGG